jgi:hypothetical protein
LRFSLRELMGLTLSAAVIVSGLQLRTVSWDYCVLAALGLWFVLGLFREAWDLWWAHRLHTWESREAAWGWRLGIAWRVGLGMLILVMAVIPHFEAAHVISLPEAEDTFSVVGLESREAILRLALLAAVTGSWPWRHLTEPRRFRARLCDALGWTAALGLGLFICFHAALLPFIVHVAIRGIEAAQPLMWFGQVKNPNAYVDLRAAIDRFFGWSAFSVSLIPVNLLLTCQLARQWRHGVLRQVLLAGPLVAGLAVTAAFAVWAQGWGFSSVSPLLGAELQLEPVHRWTSAGVLLGLLAVVVGMRFIRDGSEAKPISNVAWRHQPLAYYHQRIECIAVLGIVSAGLIVTKPCELGSWLSWLTRVPVFSLEWPSIIGEVVLSPMRQLDAAILLVAITWLRKARRYTDNPHAMGPFAMSAPGLAAVLPALFVALASGIPTLYWFAFALWLKSA